MQTDAVVHTRLPSTTHSLVTTTTWLFMASMLAPVLGLTTLMHRRRTLVRLPAAPVHAPLHWPKMDIGFWAGLCAVCTAVVVICGLVDPASAASVGWDAAEPPLVNCISSGSMFFINERFPAVLLVGASLSALFFDFKRATESEVNRAVQLAYTMLVSLTVALELSCVFIATAASEQVAAGGVNPMAPDTITFLIREYEFLYLMVRVQFFMGLLSFITALALHAIATFSVTSRRLASACLFLWASTALSLICYMNTTDGPYGSFLNMVLRCTQLLVTTLTQTGLGMSALVAAGGAFFCFCLSLGESPEMVSEVTRVDRVDVEMADD